MWLRVIATLFLLPLAVRLVDRHDPISLLSGILLGAALALTAFSPRPLYDGRAEAWLGGHKLIGACLTTVLGAAVLFLLVSVFLPGG